MVLLRQALLTVHELGHTLGFPHNWAANMNNRSSVMEYPTPRVKVTNGKLDLSESFMKEIGAYDIMTVRYAYTPFAPEREKAGLDAIIKDIHDEGLVYTRDADPRYTWYDDRETPMANLKETAAVRKIALANYGTAMLKPGEPIGSLRDIRLWIVYLNQRYAIESATQYIGGMFQNLTTKDEAHPLPPTEFIPAGEQREVMSLLMDVVDPKNLEIPESLLVQLAPDPDRHDPRAAVRSGARRAHGGPRCPQTRHLYLSGHGGRCHGRHLEEDAIGQCAGKGAAACHPGHRHAGDDGAGRRQGHRARSPRLCAGPAQPAGRRAEGAQGRRSAHRRLLSPVGAPDRALPDKSGSQCAQGH
jgi:hypothetical protein